MAGFYLRGALVEYGSDVLGPIPNIVVFQFNPEQLSRTLTIPGAPAATQDTEGSGRQVEQTQTGAPPQESIQLTAHFSAADDLGDADAGSAIPRVFGIGPQLAALQKMAQPTAGLLSGLIGEAVDAIGDALGLGGDDDAPTRPVPRENLPKILFIWGPSRVVPVRIQSMAITEQKFDPLLNPVQAQVMLGLQILQLTDGDDNAIGYGSLQYTETVKEAQALLNLAKVAELAVETVSF